MQPSKADPVRSVDRCNIHDLLVVGVGLGDEETEPLRLSRWRDVESDVGYGDWSEVEDSSMLLRCH